MHFELLSHSSLWLEHDGTSVLVDPWLLGTAYGDAWALLPEPRRLVERLPRPDWILFSHGHPDHFHQPTLAALRRRFGDGLAALVPQQALPHLRDAVRAAGFAEVREIPLGRDFALARDFSVRVHATRADDSLQVFRAAGVTLVNANDCMLPPSLCEEIARHAPAPDFYLGQFSAGDAYPFALEGLDEESLGAAAALPVQRMLAWATALGARCAIPIGGFVRFAHQENAWMNRWCTKLDEVRGTASVALEPLWPGDGWSEAGGFRRDASHRETYAKAFAATAAGVAPLAPRRSPPPRAELEAAAQQTFSAMFAAAPGFARRAIGRLGFHLEDADAGLTVDFAKQRLEWTGTVPEAPHYRLGAAHFAETCRAVGGWSEFHVAGRFRVARWRNSRAIENFMPASILCDLGYLGAPLHHLLRPRALRAWWARRREAVDVARQLARRGEAPFRRL